MPPHFRAAVHLRPFHRNRVQMDPLPTIANALLARRDAILQRWYEAAEADPELTTISTLSRAQFRDHIPEVLDAFARRLTAHHRRDQARASADERDGAVGHGLVRWQQGYQQRELMREWLHLHLVLVDELEAILRGAPVLDEELRTVARRELALLASDGVCESATQYAVLQRAEAAARLSDLEQALAEVKELQSRQARIWREATHDLRGGLGVVHQATAALKYGLPEGANAAPLAIAERGVAWMEALMSDLIDLARLEAGQERAQFTQFDAAALLRDLGTAMIPLAGAKRLHLTADGDDSLVVEGDPIKVRRIAQNLLLNALRYTPRGSVALRWERAAAGPPSRWALIVQDTGPGLASGNAAPMTRKLKEATDESLSVAEATSERPANAEPAMLPSQDGATAGQPPGEGIGLAIVKRLCELLDAQLELHTEQGKGSTFRVIFPAAYR